MNSSEERVVSCLARIVAREPEIRAWAYLDPQHALAQARALDRMPHKGPLHGIPIGIKDVLDTHDMPTGYGSAIYRDHRPGRDSNCVARCGKRTVISQDGDGPRSQPIRRVRNPLDFTARRAFLERLCCRGGRFHGACSPVPQTAAVFPRGVWRVMLQGRSGAGRGGSGTSPVSRFSSRIRALLEESSCVAGAVSFEHRPGWASSAALVAPGTPKPGRVGAGDSRRNRVELPQFSPQRSSLSHHRAARKPLSYALEFAITGERLTSV